MRITTGILITSVIVSLCSSCSDKGTQGEKPVKQPKQDVAKKTASPAKTGSVAKTKATKVASPTKSTGTSAPTATKKATTATKAKAKTTTTTRKAATKTTATTSAPAGSTNLFRTPADDIKLPTDADIAEGRTSSIGTSSQPASKPKTAPSISVTPGKPTSDGARLNP